ncbi:MAG: IclR family transcriptional regulator C-terminal domain-containing protein [Lentisphaeria bacterium]|nr:IclR family transcriptional regulator C-terminal domain-containing protein [Lentisphaeria bacterium]
MASLPIQSIEHAFRVLDQLGQGGSNLSSLSQSLGLSAPGTLKIVKTLEALGMICQGADKRYELSVGCGKYARAYCVQHPLRELARPVLERLALLANDRVVLSVLQGSLQSTLLVVDPRQGLRHPELEIPHGPHPSLQLATGRVLLAHAPWECALEQLALYPAAYLPADVRDEDGLMKLLAAVRRDGYALVPTSQLQVTYSAVPVHGHGGAVVAALGMHITAPKNTDDSLALARQAAAELANVMVP